MIYDHLKVAPVASFTAKFNLSGYDFHNFTFKLSYWDMLYISFVVPCENSKIVTLDFPIIVYNVIIACLSKPPVNLVCWIAFILGLPSLKYIAFSSIL